MKKTTVQFKAHNGSDISSWQSSLPFTESCWVKTQKFSVFLVGVLSSLVYNQDKISVLVSSVQPPTILSKYGLLVVLFSGTFSLFNLIKGCKQLRETQRSQYHKLQSAQTQAWWMKHSKDILVKGTRPSCTLRTVQSTFLSARLKGGLLWTLWEELYS